MTALWLMVALAWGRPAEDPVALASLLVSDGHLDRAAEVLDGVDPEAVDMARVYSLRGLVWLQQGAPERAAQALRRAVELRPEDPAVRLYLGRALLLSGRPGEVGAALGHGAVDSFPGAWVLRAQAARALGDLSGAWAALAEGAERSPDTLDFPRQLVLLLVEHGLTQEALAQAQALMSREQVQAADLLTVAEALRRGGRLREAAVLLERARARFPQERDLWVRSAAVAVDADQLLTGAGFLQVAAGLDPALALEAAELYRRAGQLDQALRLNSAVPDPVAKARQRFGLLLQARDVERAVALAPRLRRLGLLGEDAVAYGLAYAWFRVGRADLAAPLLSGVSDPEVFAQATALRAAMAQETLP